MRLFAIFVGMAMVVTAFSSPPPRGVLPLNYKVRGTQGYERASFPEKIEMTGKSDPRAATVISNALGCQHWNDSDNIAVIESRKLSPNEKFTNTALVKNGKPLESGYFGDARAYAVAVADVQCKIDSNRSTVKIDCVNFVLRKKEQGEGSHRLPPGTYTETTNMSQVFDVSAYAKAEATATVNNDIDLSASIGDQTFNFWNVTQSAPAMSPLLFWGAQTVISQSAGLNFSWIPFPAKAGDIWISNKINLANTNVNVQNQGQNLVNGNGAAGSLSGAASGAGASGAGNGRAP